jgi:PP-loop superfamily ATP-utilizing enzyme
MPHNEFFDRKDHSVCFSNWRRKQAFFSVRTQTEIAEIEIPPEDKKDFIDYLEKVVKELKRSEPA